MSDALPYLDIHSHLRTPLDNVVAVRCLSLEELRLEHAPWELTSAGIHPWWLEDLTSEEIERLKTHVRSLVPKLVFVGETGIDRVYPEFLEEQKKLFIWHWDLAEEHGLPLVIHSVRSGSDFLELMKKRRPETPWIFHDFRGNEQLLKDLLRLHEGCHFSFGLSLDNSPQVRELLPSVPMDHLFLETDEQKHLDIHDIHLRAAECLHIDLDLLKSQIWMNFKRISPSFQ